MKKLAVVVAALCALFAVVTDWRPARFPLRRLRVMLHVARGRPLMYRVHHEGVVLGSGNEHLAVVETRGDDRLGVLEERIGL